jgi:RND superfamily putative drug exporter
VGGGRAATAITVAGLVLALSFALLALVPIRAFRELAFAMAAGLLIDAFVVRTLLVPALIALVGPRGAWPASIAPPPPRAAATPPPRTRAGRPSRILGAAIVLVAAVDARRRRSRRPPR